MGNGCREVTLLGSRVPTCWYRCETAMPAENQQLPACPQVINTVFQELEVSGSNVQRLQTVSLVQV